MKNSDVENEINWVEEPILGFALQVMGGEIDSKGEALKSHSEYRVGKCEITGKVAIIEII